MTIRALLKTICTAYHDSVQCMSKPRPSRPRMYTILLKKHWRSLGLFLAIIIFIQIVGAYTTMQTVSTWYVELNKPFFSPPNWLFGPVWTILYLMIAAAGWLLWPDFPNDYDEKIQEPAIYCYFLQLIFNALWSPLFFGLRKPQAALVDIMLMVVFIGMTIYYTHRANNRPIVLLLAPYFLWVSFATFLNLCIVLMNP